MAEPGAAQNTEARRRRPRMRLGRHPGPAPRRARCRDRDRDRGRANLKAHPRGTSGAGIPGRNGGCSTARTRTGSGVVHGRGAAVGGRPGDGGGNADEAAHTPATMRDIKDTRAAGNRYHNKRFVALAAELGLRGPTVPYEGHRLVTLHPDQSGRLRRVRRRRPGPAPVTHP